MADKNQNSIASRLAAKFAKSQSEIAVGVALVLAAGGFTLAQLDIDLPFQWCPAGTVDRIECFRGWLISSAGWIAAIFAYLTIRQVRKQVDNLEREMESNSAAETESFLRSFKNEMFNFHGLEVQLFQDLEFAVKYFDDHGRVEDELYTKITSMLARLKGYDWTRLRTLDQMSKTNAQIDMLQSMLQKIERSLGQGKTFIENARHYVFVRDIFYEKIAEETGVNFDDP